MTALVQISETEAAEAAEYVLGVTSAADRRAFEARLADAKPLRDEVAAWDEDFAALAPHFGKVDPDPSVEAGLQEMLFGHASPPSRALVGAAMWRWIIGFVLVFVVVFVLVSVGLQQ